MSAAKPRKNVHVEFQGQDFDYFVVEPFGKDGHHLILDSQPFQGRFWKGYLIHADTMKVGARPALYRPSDQSEITLKYAITKIEDASAQVAA